MVLAVALRRQEREDFVGTVDRKQEKHERTVSRRWIKLRESFGATGNTRTAQEPD